MKKCFLPEAWRHRYPELELIAQQAEASLATRDDAPRSLPPVGVRYRAFEATPPGDVRVVILGQDPYHRPGQANGLAFSSDALGSVPRSLGSIYREMATDLDLPVPSHGDLSRWCAQGVLLMNALLSVAPGRPGSHAKIGWEALTDAVIQALQGEGRPIVWLLWGDLARAKRRLIQDPANHVLEAPHPSPRSAHRGFFGSRPFSQTNQILVRNDLPPIAWGAICSAPDCRQMELDLS